MTRILLVRHGETDHGGAILRGEMDSDLTEAGRAQAEAVAERLAGEDIEAVYSSDMQHARRTAEMIGVHHDLEPTALSDLRNLDHGPVLGGEGEEDITREELAEAERGGRSSERPGGTSGTARREGEDLDDLRRRAFPFIDGLKRKHEDRTVVMVGHGWVNRAVLLAALGVDSGHGHRLHQDHGCINELQHEGYRGWKIRRVNDTAHLE